MDAAALAHLVAAAAYAGFQWTVRVLVYPQLADAGRAAPAAFPAHEAGHSRRVSRLVGPLFAALVAATALLVAASPGSPLAWACAGCTAVVLGVTAFGAVPCHRVLADRFDEAAVAALLRCDTARVVAATAQVGLGVLALGSTQAP